MKYIKNTTDFYIEENTAISLGKFDGFHRGHELLMRHLTEKKKQGFSAVIFTFDIPPRQSVLNMETKVLTTNKEKLHLFERAGVDYAVECPFTPEIMCMEPEAFIEKIVRQLHVGCIVAGEDFHFGHNRSGDYRTLQACAKKYAYEVIIEKKMKEDARDISSTFIREEIVKGNIKKANHLLGYPYFVTGEVCFGNQLGRTIGIPTANQLPPDEKLLPENGVYVTETWLDGKRYPGITNVGCKPTIDGKNPVGVETHLFDFEKTIYGKVITVEFLERVRPEQKFDSIASLKKQMQQDIATGRRYFQSTSAADKQ